MQPDSLVERECSEQFEDVEGVFFCVANEFHFESVVGVSVQPASLVNIFRSYCYKPVLAMPQVRAKLHDHVGKLVEVRPRTEVLHSFVFEHTDFLRREAMHFDYFERLTV